MTHLRLLAMAMLLVGAPVVADLAALEEQWHAVVSVHVQSGRVDYPALHQDSRFASVVAGIADANLTDSNAQQRLAFYINAYNVLAIDGILRGLSPRTALGKWRYFYRAKFTVAGERMTLNQLENDLIRAMNEPRIHFAIVCASASCPKLQGAAYRAQKLDQQLAAAAGEFINDPTKNRFSLAERSARISKIFKWFAQDFVASAGSVSTYIARYVRDPEIAAALRRQELVTRYLPYDWTLNGTPPRD